jgi:hypothetical protein
VPVETEGDRNIERQLDIYRSDMENDFRHRLADVKYCWR